MHGATIKKDEHLLAVAFRNRGRCRSRCPTALNHPSLCVFAETPWKYIFSIVTRWQHQQTTAQRTFELSSSQFEVGLYAALTVQWFFFTHMVNKTSVCLSVCLVQQMCTPSKWLTLTHALRFSVLCEYFVLSSSCFSAFRFVYVTFSFSLFYFLSTFITYLFPTFTFFSFSIHSVFYTNIRISRSVI
jgi:hypothetical protein